MLAEEFKLYETMWENLNFDSKKFYIKFGVLNNADQINYKEVCIIDTSFEKAIKKIYTRFGKRNVRDISLIKSEDA